MSLNPPYVVSGEFLIRCEDKVDIIIFVKIRYKVWRILIPHEDKFDVGATPFNKMAIGSSEFWILMSMKLLEGSIKPR